MDSEEDIKMPSEIWAFEHETKLEEDLLPGIEITSRIDQLWQVYNNQSKNGAHYVRFDLTKGANKAEALKYFNALWYGIERHMGVDPECAHWPDVIRAAIIGDENEA